MTKPLEGKKILFLRPGRDAEALSKTIRELGGEPIHLELIRIEMPSDLSALDKTLSRIDSYDWIVFTSRTGVRAFAERAISAGIEWVNSPLLD